MPLCLAAGGLALNYFDPHNESPIPETMAITALLLKGQRIMNEYERLSEMQEEYRKGGNSGRNR